MSVELLTDRQLLDRLLEASERVIQEEVKAFASMKDRLADDEGLQLTERQRHWCEETFVRLKLKPPSNKDWGKKGKPKQRPAPKYWWDGSDDSFHPLRPPPGPGPRR